MDTNVSLWALGALFTIASALGFTILRAVLQQSRDTNAKVSALGEGLNRLEVASSSSATEVTRLRDNVEKLQADVSRLGGAHELAREIVAVFTEASGKRRQGSLRRGDQ